jgi:hypothetical protein
MATLYTVMRYRNTIHKNFTDESIKADENQAFKDKMQDKRKKTL